MIPAYKHPIVNATKDLGSLPKHLYNPPCKNFYKHYSIENLFDYSKDGCILVPGELENNCIVVLLGRKPLAVSVPIGICYVMMKKDYIIKWCPRVYIIDQLHSVFYVSCVPGQEKLVEDYLHVLVAEELAHRLKIKK